jgi:predicted esterase
MFLDALRPGLATPLRVLGAKVAVGARRAARGATLIVALASACSGRNDPPPLSPGPPAAPQAAVGAASASKIDGSSAPHFGGYEPGGEGRVGEGKSSGAEAHSPPNASVLPASWPAVAAPSPRSPWCADGLTSLDDRTCYILPPAPTRTLLIYLHGIVPPRDESFEKTKVQSVILKAAQRGGVVALVPRGRPGFGPQGRRGWVGWPTTDPLYAKFAAELVGEFAAAQKKLEALLGVTFSPVYLAGSSSGAYFVARLALHGAIDVDGFGVMSGGTGMETMELTRLAPKPVYIGYGKYDGHVRRAIPTLVDVLSRAHWPIRVAEHPVDHGAREVYLEEAFSFWREHGTAPAN